VGLLVAIAVILSGTLAVIVLGFAESARDPGPTTALSVVSDPNSDNVTFVHRAGENLEPEELEVVGAKTWSSPEGEIQAGDAIEVKPEPAADNVAVTWNDEQTSTILASTSASKRASAGFIDQPVFFNTGSHPNGQVGKPKYVETRGQYAYVVFQENPGYVVTYDVSDPTNPTIADTVNTAPNPSMNGGYALSLSGDTLYVSQNGGSFTAVDISDPTSMSLRSREFTGGQGFDIATSGDYVYIADTYGSLRVFDVSNPSNPSQVTTRSVTAGGIAVNDDELYVTDFSSDEVLVYDISSPGTPSQITTYSNLSFSFPVQVDVYGDKMYVQKYQGTSIDVVDVTDPSSPSRIETITAPAQIPNGGAVRVTGGNLFLTTGSTGNGHITIYDTSDLSSPIEEYAVPGGPNIETGDIDGDYVYLPNYTDDGLTVARIR
jgi:FlaG/FlaF family flagellin (archaellin)